MSIDLTGLPVAVNGFITVRQAAERCLQLRRDSRSFSAIRLQGFSDLRREEDALLP
jgi:hypothetical protein